MFLARKEFGKAIRIFQVDDCELITAPCWAFVPKNAAGELSKLCGPGICALGRTPEQARDLIREHEKAAALRVYDALAIARA